MWIKTSQNQLVNTDCVSRFTVRSDAKTYKDGVYSGGLSYWVAAHSNNGNIAFISKEHETEEEALKVLNRIWRAIWDKQPFLVLDE